MPLFHKQDLEGDALLGIWKIDESLDELLKNSKLSNYVNELSQFKSDKRKKEWLATRLLLQTIHSPTLNISYYKSGKPFIEDSEMHISISHTKGYAMVILSDKSHVSIDAEVYSDKILRVVPRILRKDEAFALYRSPLISQLLIWCAKETLYKLLDHQYIDYTQDFKVLPFTPQEKGGLVYAMQFVDNKFRCKYIPIHYLLFDDFALTYSVIKNVQV